MRLNKRYLLPVVILSLFFINDAYCTVYYLSNSGNDSNTGTSVSNAWQTIDKLNIELSKVKAGDQVLFKCGDTFAGEISIPSTVSGIKNNPIVFGSYGAGLKPVITGSMLLSNWTEQTPTIWKTTVNAQMVSQVFENNKRLTIARTPNKGYYHIGKTSSKMSFTDPILSKPLNYWKNATIVYKKNEWLWVLSDIDSSSTDGYIHFAPKDSAMGDLVTGSGYFIQNKSELVDTLNEWYFDANSKKLYLYSTTDPSTKNIRSSVWNNGIKSVWPWTTKYITVQDLEFNEHNVAEIQLFGAGGFVVKRCNLFRSGQYGLWMNSDYVNYMRNCEISNNYIGNSAMGGIFTWNVSQSIVSGNIVKNTALYPVQGGAMFWSGCGIFLFQGDSLLVTHNKVDSSGYNGIDFEAHYSTIEKNIVQYSMLISSDGGALYNNYGTHDTIRNNILRYTIGNMEAAYPNASRYTKELYLDMDRHHYNVIENNTMEGYPGTENSGIGLAPTTTYTTIRNNVVYRCWRGINFSNFDANNKPINTLDLRHNVIYSNTKTGHPYWINAWSDVSGMFSYCDSNYLCNPYSDVLVEHLNVNKTSYYDFSEWKTLSNTDIHSILSYSHWTFPTDSSFILTNETDSFATYTFANVVKDLDNKPIDSIIIPPFSSKVFIGELSIKSIDYSTSNPTGINSVSESIDTKSGVSIYPNPVSDLLNIIIESPNSSDYIEIMDITGIIITRTKIQSDRLTINMLPYKDGIYILKTGNIAKKFIVHHEQSQ
jgi:hypothetical protein